jgi:hypothetical protein
MGESQQDHENAPARRRISRRDFLVATLGGGLGVVSSVVLAQPATRRLRGLFAAPEPGLDEDSALGLLSDEEMEEVFALAEALFPQDQDITATRHFVRHYVNGRTTSRQGYLAEYQRAVALLQETTNELLDTGQQFSELPMADRNAVLSELLEPPRTGRIGHFFDRIFGSGEIPAFRAHVVRDLLQAFYRSPDGWAVVGYSNYPGVPARDPREYTRPLAH